MLMIIRLPLVLLWIALSAIWGTFVSLFNPFDAQNVKRMTDVLKHGKRILGVEIEVRNKKSVYEHLPCIFISNHQDNFDIFIGASAIPNRTVSLGKRSLIWVPIFGIFYWLSGNILINRQNKRSAFSTMDEAAKAIKGKNTSVWIMPEGTRSRGRGLLPFKKGPFITAIKAGVPIIPVAVSNYVGKLDFNKVYAGKIIIEILPFVSTEGKSVDDASALKDHIHAMMNDAINRLDAELKNTHKNPRE